MDKPKCWVKNAIKKCTVESKKYVQLGVCPYLTQIWVNWYSFECGNMITIKIFHKNDHSKAMFFGHGTIVHGTLVLSGGLGLNS